MEYIKGHAYFCDVENKIKPYPYLNKDITCDILIIGSGIDEAILNYYLSKTYNVVLVDASRFGMCGTSAATALLEYQLDDYSKNLRKYLSESEIVSAYKMELSSIEKLDCFIKEHGNFCGFNKCASLMYSTNIFKLNALNNEAKFRLKHNFPTKIYNYKNSPFLFNLKLGLYNKNGGAKLNPYLFCKQAIENAKNQNLMFEHTKIVSIEYINNQFKVTTKYNNTITCNKVFYQQVLTLNLCTKKFV